jgi:dCMP deaminase
MDKWDKKFIKLSTHISGWSKDKNRKVGAVIVDNDNAVLSMGYNGIPRGCDDDVESRYNRPTKYLYTEHAERNAIYHAARHGVSLKDCRIYVTLFPCADCARAIIQSGITKIIAPEPDTTHEIWGEHFKAAIEMMEEAKIKIELI